MSAGASNRIRPRAAVKLDARAERTLGALAVAVLVLIGLLVVTVLIKAWPSFSYNGLSWFGSGGDVDTQLRVMREGTAIPGHGLLYFRAWPLVWGTALTTILAVALALVVSTLAAIFLTEFAPARVRRVLEPVIRLLAGVPSVVYGLVGILAIAPWINEHLLDNARKQSVAYVVQLSGANLMTATLILMVMITPIMVAISVERAGGGPTRLARRLGGPRRESLAHDLACLAAHGAPGDRRGDRARDRARAR